MGYNSVSTGYRMTLRPIVSRHVFFDETTIPEGASTPQSHVEEPPLHGDFDYS